jgi:hypothetical protein
MPMILMGRLASGRERTRANWMNESKENLKRFGFVPVEEGVPPIGHTVTVVTKHLRCIGFLDRCMNWRYVRDHGLIHDVIGWGVLDLEEK